MKAKPKVEAASRRLSESAPNAPWPLIPISEVADINPRPDFDTLTDDTLVSFIPMKCVEEESGRFQPLGDKPVKEVKKGYTPFQDGDVLFAKVTPCMENGKAAVMRGLTNGAGFGSTEFYALRPKPELLADYLFHFITQQSFRKEAARNMTGAVGLRRVPKNYLAEQKIPLPPLPTQRKIVGEIEKQFTRLDAGVTALKRVQANLKRYRAAVLKAACEGRLVPTEAELVGRARRARRNQTPNGGLGETALPANDGYETGAQLLTRILSTRRQNWQGRGKYKEPAAPDTTNLPPLPEGWTWATVNQLAFLDVGFAFKSTEFEQSGIRLLRGDNIEPGKMRWTDTRFWPIAKLSEFQNLLINEGEIVLAMDRPLISSGLKIARARIDDLPCLLVQRMARFRPLLIEMTPVLYLELNTRDFIKHLAGEQTGTQLPHISGESIQSFPIPLPPLVEQARIVTEAERRLSIIDKLDAIITASFSRANRLRQSILNKHFT